MSFRAVKVLRAARYHHGPPPSSPCPGFRSPCSICTGFVRWCMHGPRQPVGSCDDHTRSFRSRSIQHRHPARRACSRSCRRHHHVVPIGRSSVPRLSPSPTRTMSSPSTPSAPPWGGFRHHVGPRRQIEACLTGSTVANRQVRRQRRPRPPSSAWPPRDQFGSGDRPRGRPGRRRSAAQASAGGRAGLDRHAETLLDTSSTPRPSRRSGRAPHSSRWRPEPTTTSNLSVPSDGSLTNKVTTS